MTKVFQIRKGEWEVIVDGILVAATFNSHGAALAAIDVERRRRQIKKSNYESNRNHKVSS